MRIDWKDLVCFVLLREKTKEEGGDSTSNALKSVTEYTFFFSMANDVSYILDVKKDKKVCLLTVTKYTSSIHVANTIKLSIFCSVT